ncbi:MAG: aldo/keto reductase [Ignavibacteriales bacterium]|nr:aldo/keto reductase [Ignavibacteriales bacterium]
MHYRKIGNSGLEGSVIALGTWVMGGWMWGGADELESINAIHAGLDSGINFIDTAPMYGFGYSEEVVAKALKGKRDKVILATKFGLRWDLQEGTFFFNTNRKNNAGVDEEIPVYKNLSPDSIVYELENSLKRLQTDYIDLYQSHWQAPSTAIEDTMAALLKLQEQGKIRAIGVCNATVAQMKEYGAIVSDQEKYHMLHRKIEADGNVDYCVENNLAVLAYSPIAQGLLTGRVTPGRTYNQGDLRLNSPFFKEENVLKINAMLDEFKPIAEEYNLTLGQLALAWTFNRRGITHLLCGARTPAQARENAAAGDVQISEADINSIDSIWTKYFGNGEA